MELSSEAELPKRRKVDQSVDLPQRVIQYIEKMCRRGVVFQRKPTAKGVVWHR